MPYWLCVSFRSYGPQTTEIWKKSEKSNFYTFYCCKLKFDTHTLHFYVCIYFLYFHSNYHNFLKNHRKWHKIRTFTVKTRQVISKSLKTFLSVITYCIFYCLCIILQLQIKNNPINCPALQNYISTNSGLTLDGQK